MEYVGYMLIILVVSIQIYHGEAKVEVSDIKLCTNKKYPFNVKDIGVKPVEDDVLLTFKVNSTMDIDNENYYRLKADRMIGNKYKPIINIKQKGACNAVMSYGGEIYLNAAKQAKIPHYEKCPIEKGRYILDWYRIKISAISLFQIVPPGKYRCSFKLFKISEQDEQFCMQFMASKF